MLKLPEQTKLQLFNLLNSQQTSFLGKKDILDFLEMIWELRTMPSKDSRFRNARDDAFQHLVNNNDWDISYTFLDRFSLLDNDDDFNKFLETVVSPEIRHSKDDIIQYIFLIEPFIAKENYVFTIEEYLPDNTPIYKLSPKSASTDYLFDLNPNSIPFIIEWEKTGNSRNYSSHTPPEKYPSFVLVFNDGWNDFNIYSLFSLFYYKSDEERYKIGDVKIISDSDSKNIHEDLDSPFNELSEHFCSLGQSPNYYTTLKNILSKDFESVLHALRDAAFFPDNHERFEKNSKFNSSIIRDDEAEQLLRTAKYISYGYDLKNLYSFSYSFSPRYAESPINIDFEFSKESNTSNRIYAIIGKNGTGKTQLITSLPLDISEKKDQQFVPRTPLFSKVIAVSYSVFDQFEIPKKSASFNYVYCGLRKQDRDAKEGDTQFSEKGLALRFYSSWKKIKKQGRLISWKKVISTFLDSTLIDYFISGKDIGPNGDCEIDTNKFQETKKKFSSGQSIVFYIITEIVANIRYDSILLYDEPETHLHPNAITELIHVIHELVEEFESYCIIATHSPIIIRELFSKNVYVLEREDSIPSIRGINIESFGEDIGVLTDEVFGNKEVPKQYKQTIDSLAATGKSFEEIINNLESNEIPLGLNTRLYIRSAVKLRNA